MRESATVKPARPGRSLVFSMIAVVFSFLTASIYGQYRVSSIDDEAEQVASLAAPSLRHLADAQSDLRRLQQTIGAAVRSALQQRPIDRTAIREARRSLDEHLASYA